MSSAVRVRIHRRCVHYVLSRSLFMGSEKGTSERGIERKLRGRMSAEGRGGSSRRPPASNMSFERTLGFPPSTSLLHRVAFCVVVSKVDLSPSEHVPTLSLPVESEWLSLLRCCMSPSMPEGEHVCLLFLSLSVKRAVERREGGGETGEGAAKMIFYVLFLLKICKSKQRIRK